MDIEKLEDILNDLRKFCMRNNVIITDNGWAENILFDDFNNDYSRLDNMIIEFRDNTLFAFNRRK